MIKLDDLTITKVQKVLKFETPASEFYTCLIDAFKDIVKHKLDALLLKIKQNTNAVADSIEQKLTLLYAGGYPEVMLSPEILAILLNYEEDKVANAAQAIDKMLDAELAQQQKKFDTSQYSHLWTSNGDYFIHFDAEKQDFVDYEAPKFNDVIVFDFLSPACLQVNNDTLGDHSDIVANYDFETAPELYDKIDKAFDLVDFDNGIRELVLQMTRMIIVKRQFDKDTKAAKFWSATHSNYIGKMLLVNTDVATTEDIIDGMVHEAVHSLLYIVEELNPWMPSKEVSVAIGNEICSPWTNNLLPLRAFLHALFVWYSLFNLWNFALKNGLYDQADAKKRVEAIRKGYAQINIQEDVVDKLQVALDPELIKVIEHMKEHVLTN